MKASMRVGIDVGSTTVKVAVLDARGSIVFSRYGRHYARTLETIRAMLHEAERELGDVALDVTVTGSAGLGLAERCGLPFIQEVVASARLIKERWPEVKTLIEVGGEDSKVVFFDERFHPDMRMNGSCAGGTGAFIDQMAALLGVDVSEFNGLAAASSGRHTIASRCGVFAKTDVQSLLSNHVPKEDIAASVFHAVALQVAATLFRGAKVREKVLFAGGPLHFFPLLRSAFADVLGLDELTAIVEADRPELIAAIGAALCHGEGGCTIDIHSLIERLGAGTQPVEKTEKLPALFASEEELRAWRTRHGRHVVERADLRDIDGQGCFLGIDSGSTTTKIVLMDDSNRVVLTHYGSNHGDPIEAARTGLNAIGQQLKQAGISITIAGTAVTGYGEDLIKAAFGLDEGVVETVAHFRAAQTFDPNVSFILDIGGQDMKAIFIVEKTISDIQINEACSSGCGSFMETLARSLNFTIDEFAQLACDSREPFDLGTRCTVFMNSKIKQAQREGALLPDIAAGLAYAVIKNSLHKVLKLTDVSVLGDHIVVQGGTFRNPAVLRAFELLTGREAIRPDMAELMGAYGAAIIARESSHAHPGRVSGFIGFDGLERPLPIKREMLNCRGCENNCRIARLRFAGGRAYVTGNRCEKCFSNRGRVGRQGQDLVAAKIGLLFDRPLSPAHRPVLRFGIPRALNMYENFPFWCAYLRGCGFEVVLSSPSNTALFEKGVATVMSDNICFPGKLVHGHIRDLIEKKVDRIFYPNVVYEHQEQACADNCYNCPVVTGYPDVIKSAMNPEEASGIPLDAPAISFKDPVLLERQLARFVKPFGVGRSRSRRAFRQALKEQARFKERLRLKAQELIAHAAARHEPVVVLCGRPYHIDPLINHGIPALMADMGVHVITEDSLPPARREALTNSRVLTQWAYSNRIMAAAEYVGAQEDMRMVQLTSFGCGLDAVSTDEVRRILKEHGRTHMLIKIDEITNLGAVKIRLRSFLQTAWGKGAPAAQKPLRPPAGAGACRPVPEKILIPWVSPLYSPLLEPLFRAYGYDAEILPPPDRSSVERGLM
ncbi:MAG TPA: acyl-CoA dehydratase activase, partial [Deltaproteobacteria bacterium]|nr:acyl-CoA dehydratase activase [Deltaproteobacteria bacterium]